MKKLFAKMRKVRMTRWRKLTSGEKVMKVVMTLVKYAVLAAVVAAVASAVVAVAVAVGVVVAFGVMNAVAGGLGNASRAYRPGDRYVRFF